MNTAPLFASSLAIQLHVFAACAAFLVGLAQFIGKKGATTHRVLGWSWVVLMATTALTSFWIVDYRTFKPTALILFLSILVLVQLPLAVRHARRHNIQKHKSFMTWLYINALIIAGVFTFLPGRLMYRVVFG